MRQWSYNYKSVAYLFVYKLVNIENEKNMLQTLLTLNLYLWIFIFKRWHSLSYWKYLTIKDSMRI